MSKPEILSTPASGHRVQHVSASGEAQLTQAMNEYLEALEAGRRPNRDGLLKRYPEIAEELATMLDGVDFIHNAAPELAKLEEGPAHEADSGIRPSVALGDFQIIRQIGKGGMGVVYEAEQLSLGRRVALKVLPFAAMLSSKQLQRFKNEARAAASLRHPNIVHVYSVGSERGVHYYAMEYVEGQTVARAIEELRRTASLPRGESDIRPGCDDTPVGGRDAGGPSRTRASDTKHELQAAISTERSDGETPFVHFVADLGIQAARGLAHAHELGVVHRDIKPSNLMIDIQGHVWITDFGLARTGTDGGLTMTGDLLGTVQYMSPEQSTGDHGVLDHRTDIYSLGLTLYELLTLKPAFEGDNRRTLLRQIAEEEPIAPRRLTREVPSDLETIVLKAMAKDPADRYVSARELANDLCRFVDDKPIRAKRPSLTDRLAKWSRRHAGLLIGGFSVLVLVLVLLSTGIAILFRQQSVTEAALRRSEQRLGFARRTVDEMYDRVARDWIADDRALSAVQRELLMSALHTYEQLATETSTRPETQHQVAAAYRRAADIRNRLGLYDTARAAYEKAVALQLPLVQQQPDNPSFRNELWGTYLHLGNLLLSTGQLAEAREMYDAARKQVARLARDDPSNGEHRWGIQTSDINIAEVLKAQGNYPEAEAVIRQSRKDFDYFQSHPRSAYRARWIMASGILAAILRQQNRLDEAEAVCREALSRCTGLLHVVGDIREYRRLTAGINSVLARTLATTGRLEEAAGHYRKSLELQQQALPFGMTPSEYAFAYMAKKVEDRSNEPEAFCSYADTQCHLGVVLHRLGEEKEAERLIDEAERTCRAWSTWFPHVLSYKASRAGALHQLGALRTETQPEQAIERLGDAASIWRELRQEAPQVWEYRDGLAKSLCQMACLHAYGGDDSVIDSPAAVRLAQEAVEVAPEKRECWTALGAAHCRVGNADKAIEAIGRSTALGDEESVADGFILAMAHIQSGRSEEAHATFQRAVIGMEPEESHETSARLEHLRSEAARMLQIGPNPDATLKQRSPEINQWTLT